MAASGDADARQLAGTRTILIGDDPAAVDALAALLLDARGAVVERAADGEEALALAARGRPDALVAFAGTAGDVRARFGK